MMGLQFCDGRVAGLALRSQTQIREPHHANLTLNVSDSQKRGSRVLRQRKGATITAIFDKRAAADAF
jgi:hypothetical protein